MNESRNVFVSRIDKSHIQREEIYEFYQLCQKGKAISGFEEDEFKKLLKDLENDSVNNSNDMVIEMIISCVRNYTSNPNLKRILENISIANIAEDNSIMGRAYPKYSDDSYYVEIGRNIAEKITLLSDIFAVLFMYKDDTELIERVLLDNLLKANLQRFSKNEKTNERFETVQICMLIFEKLKGNHDFTDNYVAYAREIYEIAIAFLVGHEVGHHYLGHTDRNIKSSENVKLKELKADFYGIDFAIDYLQSAYANDKKEYGIHQFSGVYIPIIASAYFCDDIFADGERHLSIAKRFDIVEKKLVSQIDKKAYQEVRNYILNLLKVIQFEKKVI